MLDLSIFDQIQAKLDVDAKEQEDIKVSIKELERHIRTVRSIINTLYTIKKEEFQGLLAKAFENLKPIQHQLLLLASIVPENRVYKYQHLWNSTSQQICSLIAIIIFLSENRLIKPEDITKHIGVPVLLDQDICGAKDGQLNLASKFHFTLEDYLHGLINLSNEIPRLAITAVIQHQDYNRPNQLAQFLSELNAGFQLLNLKNDNLRRRFDSLKYDIKKVEEIVYDITIRGLVK